MANRGRHREAGLSYFPKMIDFYEDDKIFDLLDRYGPLGVTVYDCILCIVYKHGYYAEIPLDKLSKMIIKMIGNKWVKTQKAVVQVVHFCSEIGLLDDGLMTENIITSVGIQRRYYEIAVKRMKRQLYSKKYWLLDEENNSEGLLNAPKNQITSEEKRLSSEENRFSSEESDIEIKENKSIYISSQSKRYFEDKETEQAFLMYLNCRKANGDKLNPEQIKLLKEELIKLSSDTLERIAIIKKATMSNWKSFYPLKKQKDQTAKLKKSRFSNFEERNYNYENIERKILEKRTK